MWIIYFLKLLPFSIEGAIIIAVSLMMCTRSRDSLQVTWRVSFSSRTEPRESNLTLSFLSPLHYAVISFLSIPTAAWGITAKHIWSCIHSATILGLWYVPVLCWVLVIQWRVRQACSLLVRSCISVITLLLLAGHVTFNRLFNAWTSIWPMWSSVFSSINGDHYCTYPTRMLQRSSVVMYGALSAGI